MKKVLIIAAIILVVAVLFVPIPSSGNEGTKIYSALTYKIVKWDEYAGGTKLSGTKVYFLPDNFKSTDTLLEEEAGKLDETTPADTTADDTPGDDTTAPVTDEVVLAPYDGEWIEKSENTTVDAIDFSDIVIKEIYTDCFIATPIIPFPIRYKINWEYSDKWCVGDHVSCVCENCYCDGERYEGDLVSIEPSDFEPDPDVAYKPVIYLYPEEETDVTVRLDPDGELTCTYPEYKDGWRVTASPDGTLTDGDGTTYNYLYWEGECDIDFDFSQGFCVRGRDTAAFLEVALADAGLSRREANEFIVYWLPLMQDNEYNVISFQGAPYTDAAPLDVTPSPDTVIRVFMAWYASDTALDIEPQTLSAPARDGFTLVEWGGTEIVK